MVGQDRNPLKEDYPELKKTLSDTRERILKCFISRSGILRIGLEVFILNVTKNTYKSILTDIFLGLTEETIESQF
ncbi:hypothetical protein [Aquimarina sp. RZ0]|uniref:hypothetical protein n=1 Tax=Aquimarina sp. RZ0 TaxID=2607730 RepID=UPI0011F24411|nr:hypothetical protein [Aquimarina sp. RZ0]